LEPDGEFSGEKKNGIEKVDGESRPAIFLDTTRHVPDLDLRNL